MLLGTKKELSRMPVEKNASIHYVYDWFKRYATIKEAVDYAVSSGTFIGKGVRSYMLFPPHLRLDHSKPWFGFEVETGFDRLTERMDALIWVNNKTRYATFDNEGSGEYPAEISFYPTHSVNSLERNCGPLKIINAIEAGEFPHPADHLPQEMIGTHFNLSTPFTRDGRNKLAVETMIDRLARACDYIAGAYEESDDDDEYPEQALCLFGRRPYNVRPIFRCPRFNNNEPHFLSSFIEFKWFNTTYSKEQWFGYCVVMRWLIDFFSEDRSTVSKNDIIDELNRIAQIAAECARSGQPHKGGIKCLV